MIYALFIINILVPVQKQAWKWFIQYFILDLASS